jgi:2-polyprenyl-3-methyl-5-hydroxy-6-metoxy-1,4-benzoquinol methylase
MDKTLTTEYTNKKEDYYNCPRPEMLEFIPKDCRAILDVGCGRGFFGASLRNINKSCVVWGVEPDPACISGATKNLDKIVHGVFESSIGLPEEHFDCIIFNDVLEHILDPVPVLHYARKILKKNGVVVASIPNISHFPILWKLIVRGEWNYTERGILDKTHLRFYTRKSIQQLFETAGLTIKTEKGINPYHSMEAVDEKLWWKYKVLENIPLAGVRDMRYLQFAIVAENN